MLAQYSKTRLRDGNGRINEGNVIGALYRISDAAHVTSYFDILRDGDASIYTGTLCALIMKTGEAAARTRLDRELAGVTDPEAHIAHDGTWDEKLFGPLPLDHWVRLIDAR